MHGINKGESNRSCAQRGVERTTSFRVLYPSESGELLQGLGYNLASLK